MRVLKSIREMRRNHGKLLLAALSLVCAISIGGLTFAMASPVQTAAAESVSEPAQAPGADTSPAIYVNEKNANSVVGIITNAQAWDRNNGVQNTMISQGSGVVIAEEGYVLTNYHVIENGNAYQVLMPDGSKVEATLTGSDSSLDLAVLKVSEGAEKLVPVTIGSSDSLKVGATAIAIGNPGGEMLANTVTQGIISALRRSNVNSSNTARNVNYIQHNAAISSGSSGGGLFDYQGNLIGINTLKYAGNSAVSGTYEGLGFAIPVETAYPIARQLIENGKVIRPQMGVVVANYEGPDEPMNDYPPASVCVYSVNADSPAQKAGIQQYDFITAVNGERVTNLRQLTTTLDQFQPGDTVKLTIVRYNSIGQLNNNANNYYINPFNYGFGGFNYGYGGQYSDYYGNGGNQYRSNNNVAGGSFTVGGGYTTLYIDVTLEVKED